MGVHDLNFGLLACAARGFEQTGYVLISVVKKELHLDALTCLRILSVSVFEKTEVSCALQPDRSQREPPLTANQLILFDFNQDSSDLVYISAWESRAFALTK